MASVTRGDYEEITFTITNPDGTPRNITPDTITFGAKLKLKDVAPLVSKTSIGGTQIVKSAQSGATLGQGKVVLQPTDLAGITTDGQTLYCDLVVTDSSSKPYSTRFELSVILDVSG